MKKGLLLPAVLAVAGVLAACGAPPGVPTTAVRAAVETATPALPAPPSPTMTAVPEGSPSPALQTPPGPLVMAASVPVRVRIPSIAVDSELMELGLLDDGSMEVPPGAFPAGWFSGAPTPGELGPSVIAGHVDWVTGPGVFYELTSVAAGDEVLITRADGTVAIFRVTTVGEYPKDAFPTDLVYGDIDHAGLRLITCGGSWNPQTKHYEANVVVFAELVGAGPARGASS